jgi:hypothetical protein
MVSLQDTRGRKAQGSCWQAAIVTYALSQLSRPPVIPRRTKNKKTALIPEELS